MAAQKSRRKKGFKTDLEGILIISHLLDGKGYVPDELIKKINARYDIYDKNRPSNRILIPFYLNWDDSLDDLGKASNQSVGRALKALKESQIVEVTRRRASPKPGGDPSEWNLILSIHTLKKILNKLYNGNLNKSISRMIGSEILNSDYGRSLVNINLVKENLDFTHEQFKNYGSEQFDENELNIILNIIKTSPQALLRFISAMEDPEKYQPTTNKSNFITGLMSDLGNDIMGEGIFMGGGLLVNNPIEYNIQIKFNPDIKVQPCAILKDDPFMGGDIQIHINHQKPYSEIKIGKNEIKSTIRYPAELNH